MTTNLENKSGIDAVDTKTTPASITEFVLDDVPAEPRRLSAVRSAILSWLRGLGMDEDRSQDITLATYEAMANSVEHAYNAAEIATTNTVTLRARCRAGATLTVVVEDNGSWTDSDRDPRRGRGLPLIQALTDEASVDTDSRGTTVRMRWDL